ncbi:MAG TPA: hypothetical protein VLN49_00185 [Gemmatimonadaceae bacterium]|nr:hypothetical protein [Gemmatimonadaceae bacterium]
MRRFGIPLVFALAATLASCDDVPQPLMTSPTTANRALTDMGSGHTSDTTAIIYSNFGQGLTFNRWNPLSFVLPGVAARLAWSQQFFTPPGDYQFVRATVALRNTGSDQRIRVFLQADAMGQPGPIIDSVVVDATSSLGATYVASSLRMPVLEDSLYWLTVAPTSPEQLDGWFRSNIEESSEVSFAVAFTGEPTGPWSVFSGLITRGAFQIEGRAIGSRGAVMHQASGGGTVVWETPEGKSARVTWAVSAQSMINGNTTGQFLALGHDQRIVLKGSVSCLVVIGNRAYVTVDVTQAPAWAFDPIPEHFALGLEDNGEGAKATAPDRISLLYVLYEDDPVCQRVVPSLDWTNGNAQVR